MGEYVNNGKVSIPREKPINYNIAVQEIAALIGQPASEDEKYRLRTLCTSPNINMWSKAKPFEYNRTAFETDEQRDRARVEKVYGLTYDMGLHPDNAMINILSDWRYLGCGNAPARLRDFDGYNHYVEDGLRVANAADYTYYSNIELRTNPSTEDNIAIQDILQLYEGFPFDYFQWILIDPYGFLHLLQNYSSPEDLALKLNNPQYLEIVSIQDYTETLSNWYNNPAKTIPYIPPRNGQSWMVGLCGVIRNLTTSQYKTMRFMFNTLSLPDPRATQMGLTTDFYLTGFTPNMVIGSIYSGKSQLCEYLYRSDKVLEICSDDCIFLGIQAGHYKDAPVTIDFTKIPSVEAYINGKPYWSYCTINDTSSANPVIPVGGLLGSGGSYEGLEWSKDCFFICLQRLWTSGIVTEDEINFTFTISLRSGAIANSFQCLPYVTIKVRNTGKLVSEVEQKASFFPDTRANAWNTR